MFSKFFLITALATCCLAARIPSGDVERIIGGEGIDITEAPYQVALTGNRNDWGWCGGVIYSNNIILTAAHCVVNQPSLTVRAGSTLKHRGGTEISVDIIKIHEDYDYSLPNHISPNDIAVLRLSRPLIFSESVQPIRLSEKTPVPSTDAFVSGWGKMYSYTDTAPIALRGVDLQIIDHNLCRYDIPFLTKDMLCAYAEGKTSYYKDSGGPLVINYKTPQQLLVGLVSFGRDGGGGPRVFTDVVVLRPWIENAVESLGGNAQPF